MGRGTPLPNPTPSAPRSPTLDPPLSSVLGPLLFVNDIDDSFNSKILKFADDTKVFNAVSSEKEVDSLRCDLCNLVQRSKEWQMLFNVEKCKVMRFGYNNPRVSTMKWTGLILNVF